MTPAKYKAERAKRGTQKAVADALGVHRVTIAQREAGTQRITREASLALQSLPLAGTRTKSRKRRAST